MHAKQVPTTELLIPPPSPRTHTHTYTHSNDIQETVFSSTTFVSFVVHTIYSVKRYLLNDENLGGKLSSIQNLQKLC